MNAELSILADQVVAKHRAAAPLDELSQLRKRNVRELPSFDASDVMAPIPARIPIVAGVIGPGETGVMFGKSATYKSTVGIDIAASVACGIPWCGHDTTQVPVVYLASEGGASIRTRFKGWATDKAVSFDGAVLSVIVAPVDLYANEAELRLFLLEFRERTGKWPGLIIVDTLAMSSSADENSANEIGTLLAKIRRVAEGAAVLLIHHSGLSDASRERGSYVLRASADRTIRAEREGDGPVELHCVKSKDDAGFKPITLRPRIVRLPDQDADGEPMTTIVLDPVDTILRPKGATKKHLSDEAKLALRLLREHIAKTGHEYDGSADVPAGSRVLTFAAWRKAYRDACPPDDARSEEARRKAFTRASDTLQAAGIVRVTDAHAFIVEVRHG